MTVYVVAVTHSRQGSTAVIAVAGTEDWAKRLGSSWAETNVNETPQWKPGLLVGWEAEVTNYTVWIEPMEVIP